MLKIGRENPKWNDDNQTQLQITYHISPSLAFYSTGSAYVFADRQSGFVNDISTQTILAGIRFDRLNKISISPGIGWKSDTRYHQQDEGLTFNFNTLINEQEINGYYNTLNFFIEGDNIGPRTNRDTRFSYKIYKEFYKQTADTIAIISSQKRRDNYVSNADEIETFHEKMNSIYHSLKYRLTDDLYVVMHNRLTRRQVEVSHKINYKTEQIFDRPFISNLTEYPLQIKGESRKRTDFNSDNDLSLVTRYSSFKSHIGLQYWSQEQLYDIPAAAQNLPFSFRTSFVAQDNQSYEISAFSRLGWQFMESDSLGFDASISRLQYDTPDTGNFDDRDEFRLNLSLIEVHIFSPYLRMQVEANVKLYHHVYIFAERSADNNWTRVFRLSPALCYNPFSTLKLNQYFEILAKYVDFDYEFENRDISSFVYRQFSSVSKVEYRFLKATWLQLSYRIQLEENGKLFWDRWAERPLFIRNNYWFRASLSYKPSHYLEISPGMNLYARDEWRYVFARTGTPYKEKSYDFQSFGPMLTIYYQPNSAFQFSMTANRQSVSSANQKSYSISAIDIFLNWYF